MADADLIDAKMDELAALTGGPVHLHVDVARAIRKAKRAAYRKGEATATSFLKAVAKLNGSAAPLLKGAGGAYPIRDSQGQEWHLPTTAPTPDDATDPHAALYEALLAAVIDAREAGDNDAVAGLVEAYRDHLHDPETLTAALAGAGSDDVVAKAIGRVLLKAGKYDENKHPRDDHGRFVSRDAIADAKGDPAKEEALRDKVTDPEQREKLDNALAGTTDLGRTKAGQKRHEAGQRREKRAASHARAAELADKIAGGTATPDDMHELGDHLEGLTVDKLRYLQGRIPTAGRTRRKAEMVAALRDSLEKSAHLKRVTDGAAGVAGRGGADPARLAIAGMMPNRYDVTTASGEVVKAGTGYQRFEGQGKAVGYTAEQAAKVAAGVTPDHADRRIQEHEQAANAADLDDVQREYHATIADQLRGHKESVFGGEKPAAAPEVGDSVTARTIGGDVHSGVLEEIDNGTAIIRKPDGEVHATGVEALRQPEPHEMTKQEYIDAHWKDQSGHRMVAELTKRGMHDNAEKVARTEARFAHGRQVMQAIMDGKTVPEHVLKDYPELDSKVMGPMFEDMAGKMDAARAEREGLKAARAKRKAAFDEAINGDKRRRQGELDRAASQPLAAYLADLGVNEETVAKVMGGRTSASGYRISPETGSNISLPSAAGNYYRTHREAVMGALRAGKPVPPEVLADYPDLAPKPPAATPAASGSAPGGDAHPAHAAAAKKIAAQPAGLTGLDTFRKDYAHLSDEEFGRGVDALRAAGKIQLHGDESDAKLADMGIPALPDGKRYRSFVTRGEVSAADLATAFGGDQQTAPAAPAPAATKPARGKGKKPAPTPEPVSEKIELDDDYAARQAAADPASAHAATLPEGSPARAAIEAAVANGGGDKRRTLKELGHRHAEMAHAMSADEERGYVEMMGKHGVKPLHEPGQTVPFDPETMASDTGISTGTPVKVTRRGWSGLYGDAKVGHENIGNNVQRAQVEPAGAAESGELDDAGKQLMTRMATGGSPSMADTEHPHYGRIANAVDEAREAVKSRAVQVGQRLKEIIDPYGDIGVSENNLSASYHLRQLANGSLEGKPLPNRGIHGGENGLPMPPGKGARSHDVPPAVAKRAKEIAAASGRPAVPVMLSDGADVPRGWVVVESPVFAPPGGLDHGTMLGQSIDFNGGAVFGAAAYPKQSTSGMTLAHDPIHDGGTFTAAQSRLQPRPAAPPASATVGTPAPRVHRRP